MKKLTNYTLGPRGINTKAGTVWIDPGETVEIDEKDVIGALPELGKKPGASDSDGDEVAALTGKLADLTKQVETLTSANKALEKDKADLTKQVETLTKPAAK